MKKFLVFVFIALACSAAFAEPKIEDGQLRRELLREQIALVKLQRKELYSRMELQAKQKEELEESIKLKKRIHEVLGEYHAQQIVEMVRKHLIRLGWY